VLQRSILVGIAIADFGEVVVARIGIAALTILQASGQGVVIVALDALHSCIPQKREDTVRIRPKGPKIAQAVNSIRASAFHVTQGRMQRTIITVDAAEECQPGAHRGAMVPSTVPLTFWQNVPYS